MQSEPNKLWLLEAIKGGNDGLLKLAVEVTRLSLEDARRIHKSKLDIINPLSRILDWEVGPGYQGRKLEDDEVELMTICEDVEQALHNYVIYCELFHHNVDTALEPSLPIEWMVYCKSIHHYIPASRSMQRLISFIIRSAGLQQRT